jgi:hypothetical protein
MHLARGQRPDTGEKRLYVLDESFLASTRQMHEFMTRLHPSDRADSESGRLSSRYKTHPKSPLRGHSAAAAACYAVPKIPCLGLFPDYDTARVYKKEAITETPRQHITRKHILGTPTATPLNTVYVNPASYPVDEMFTLVQAYNFATVLLNPVPAPDGSFQHTYSKITQVIPTGTVEKGWIGIDASGNDLYTNKLFLSVDRCTVNTSFPTK